MTVLLTNERERERDHRGDLVVRRKKREREVSLFCILLLLLDSRTSEHSHCISRIIPSSSSSRTLAPVQQGCAREIMDDGDGAREAGEESSFLAERYGLSSPPASEAARVREGGDGSICLFSVIPSFPAADPVQQRQVCYARDEDPGTRRRLR